MIFSIGHYQGDLAAGDRHDVRGGLFVWLESLGDAASAWSSSVS